MIAAIISALAAAFKAAVTWMGFARDKLLISLGASQERTKVNEAEAATQEALKDITDERAAVPDAATDADDIARELRKQKSGGGTSDRKRPF